MPRRKYSGKIATLRPHLLDFLRLDEPAPRHALTLAEWSQPIALRSLLATVRSYLSSSADAASGTEPLLSLWAQWYIGLLVPPLMLALLNEPQGLSTAPEHFHVEFHESGRAACFWIDVHSDADIERLSPQARMDATVTRTLQPVVEALAATGEINSKLIWSNTGYLINWYLGEMRALLGDERLAALRQHCF